MKKRINWCLIGIPDHAGVFNVGGRLGAAAGPKALFRMLARLKGRDGVLESLATQTEISGITQDVKTNHRQAADTIRDLHRAHPLSVIVGGGHDHGFSHLLGILEALSKDTDSDSDSKVRLGCINIDPHFDVRKPAPEITSGSPFYLALESGVISAEDFIEFGIQRHCNAPELWDYIDAKKVEVIPFERLRHGRAAEVFEDALKRLAQRCDAVVISLDLDAASSAFAPGVSAPQTEGFSSTDILEMMTLAGKEKKVASLGIFELNPLHDIDDQTARLGATSAYHFIAEAIQR